MSEKTKRFKLTEGLYIVDSSGTAPQGKALKARADRIAREVDESFDPERLRPLNPSAEDESDD